MAILVLSLLAVTFFIRRRRAATRKERIGGVSQLSASIDDANNSSIISVQEVEDNRLCGYQEMSDNRIVELPHEPPQFAELPGWGPIAGYASRRPRQPARNPATSSFAKKRLAIYSSTGSMMKTWIRQIKGRPVDNKIIGDDGRTPSFPDLNRPLPPTPDSKSVRYSWSVVNIYLDMQSGSQRTNSSDVDSESW